MEEIFHKYKNIHMILCMSLRKNKWSIFCEIKTKNPLNNLEDFFEVPSGFEPL